CTRSPKPSSARTNTSVGWGELEVCEVCEVMATTTGIAGAPAVRSLRPPGRTGNPSAAAGQPGASLPGPRASLPGQHRPHGRDHDAGPGHLGPGTAAAVHDADDADDPEQPVRRPRGPVSIESVVGRGARSQ